MGGMFSAAGRVVVSLAGAYLPIMYIVLLAMEAGTRAVRTFVPRDRQMLTVFSPTATDAESGNATSPTNSPSQANSTQAGNSNSNLPPLPYTNLYKRCI